MIISTLIREEMNLWAFRTKLPPLVSPSVRYAHKCVSEFVKQDSVKWRFSQDHPKHPLIEFLGWQGQFELTGTACYVFSAMVPDAGGNLLLVYRVQEHDGLHDHTLPDQVVLEIS